MLTTDEPIPIRRGRLGIFCAGPFLGMENVVSVVVSVGFSFCFARMRIAARKNVAETA